MDHKFNKLIKYIVDNNCQSTLNLYEIMALINK